MRQDGFEVTYEVSDGYVGESRPQNFYISIDDLPDDADEAELRSIFADEVQSDFEQRCSPGWDGSHEDSFVVWAKDQIAARNEEDQ
jgi:hypothetical protein